MDKNTIRQAARLAAQRDMRAVEIAISNTIDTAINEAMKLTEEADGIYAALGNDIRSELPNTFNLAKVEKYTIEKALNETRGNREVAARLLGIAPRTLYRKLGIYKITI